MKKTLETKLILEPWDRFLNERGNGLVYTSILNKIERECAIICTDGSTDDFNTEERQSGKVNAIKGVPDLINELTSWFTEINYTKFVGHDDLFPSIVSYSLLRMPAPSNLSGLKKHIDTLQLSDIAKLYLLLVNHKVNEDFDPENSNSILFSRFRNKIVFFS